MNPSNLAVIFVGSIQLYMIRILYLVYLWLFFVPVFLVLTIVTALTVIAGCLLGGEKIFAYYPGMIWSRLTCYLALCPVKVRGRENIDRKQSYVFVSNHQGAFDIFLIYGFLGVPIKWVMKAGIGKIPFVGAACRAAGFIFVDNSTPKAAARSVQEAERCLKNGAYQMALDQHLPIVPITLNGPFDVLPIGSLNVHRHKMEMIIHPAISTEDMDPSHKGMQQFADRTQAIIASALWEKYK